MTNLQVFYCFWVGFFILFLILKSTNTDEVERHGIKDLVLGRKVPMLVFIKNKSLLKKIYANEMNEDVVT